MTDESLFAAALEQSSPEDRDHFLNSACDSPEQRARLETLLAAHDRAGSFLDRPAVSNSDDEATHSTASVGGVTRTLDPLSGDPPDDVNATAFLAPPGRPDSLGRIGHYEVLEVLGRGGFGIVYRAFDDVLQRVVAVKVLAPHLAVTSPARKRFLREARSAALIQHEHVVRIHETGESPLPYLVMEFVPGETLQQRMDRTGPLDVAETLRCARQIAAGLAAAHEKGLIHRDIKPSNVLIDAGPQQAKITDFGLARAADDASLTHSGAVAGTPMYMAPEQARGEPLDQRADLFSLGSVLYAMLTGHPPFRANSTPAVLKRVAEDDPRPIREVIPEVPEWVCRIVGKLHAKNPAERFQTAKEVADLLADCEKQLAERKELTDYTRIPGGKPTPKRKRWKWAAVAAGVAAVLVCGFIAWIATRDRMEGGLLHVHNLGKYDYSGAANGTVYVRNLDTKEVTAFQLVPPHGAETRALDAGTYEVIGATIADDKKADLQVSLQRFMPGDRDVPTRDPVSFTLARGQQLHLYAIVKPLSLPPDPPARADGFTPLFNGKDLSGWKRHPKWPGTWVIENGELVGHDGLTYLLSERDDYTDFRLRAEMRSAGGTGVYIRADATPDYPVGWVADTTLFKLHRGAPDWQPVPTRGVAAVPANQWFTLEVAAVGDQLTMTVNGTTVADYRIDRPAARKGRLALHVHQGGEVRFRKIEIKELPPSPPSDGFTPLFNGKDLSGWKTHPTAPGDWKVEDGAIVGLGNGKRTTSFLFSEAEYADFHLRVEAKIDALGDAGVWFRTPFNVKIAESTKEPVVVGHLAQMSVRSSWPAHTGSLLTNWPEYAHAPHGMHRADEWFVLEVIARGNHFQTRVNGKPAAEYRDDRRRYTRGRLALQVWGENNTVAHFRKVEIQELPASPQEVPRSAADVLPFLAGAWKVEKRDFDPALPPEQALTVSEAAFDLSTGGNLLALRTRDACFYYSFDPAGGGVRLWHLNAGGLAVGPVRGEFNPEKRSVVWRTPLDGDREFIHEIDFPDANSMTARVFRRDVKTNAVHKISYAFTRATGSVPPVTPFTDVKRPVEMKVLDTLAGEWKTEITVKSAVETWRTTARLTLGGRFVEMTGTKDGGGASDYAVLWYDPAAKKYRQWYFNSDGHTFPMTGTWDAAANTLSWETADKTKTGRWTFKENVREFRHAITDGKGKVLSEMAGESRRVVPSEAKPGK